MPDHPYFNPRSLYPTRGVQMPASQIAADTQMPDLFVPTEGPELAESTWVDHKFLLALIESPTHWQDEIRHHLEVLDVDRESREQRTPVCYITFNPRARLRIISRQTFVWNTAMNAGEAAAVDDAQLQVLGLEAGTEPSSHHWRACAPVAGEQPVHLCAGTGVDLGPSGKKQYWPGPELTPAGDYLPGRFMVKMAHARYAIRQLGG